jgi:tetratricopeptide (TPR) repeat protein
MYGWLSRASRLADVGRHNEALECFDRAIELEGGDPDIWLDKGKSLIKLGRNEEALKCYDKAIELRKDNFHMWFEKGKALLEIGRPDEAIACFDKVLQLFPHEEWVPIYKARCLAMMNSIEPAISLLDNLVKEQDEMWKRAHIGGSIPNFQAEALLEKGKIMLSLGRIEEAVGNIEAALARMHREPAYFAREMYDAWAVCMHRLMLQALEAGQEDKAREIYVAFRNRYNNLTGWKSRLVKSGILKSLREFKQALSPRERKLLSKFERTMNSRDA